MGALGEPEKIIEVTPVKIPDTVPDLPTPAPAQPAAPPRPKVDEPVGV